MAVLAELWLYWVWETPLCSTTVSTLSPASLYPSLLPVSRSRSRMFQRPVTFLSRLFTEFRMRMRAINLKSQWLWWDAVGQVSLHSHCDDAEAIHGQLCQVQEAVSVQGSEAAALVLSEVARPELVQVPGAGVSVAVDHGALSLARQTQTRALRWQHGDYYQAVRWVSPQHNLSKLLQKTVNKCTFQAFYSDKLNRNHSQHKISGKSFVIHSSTPAHLTDVKHLSVCSHSWILICVFPVCSKWVRFHLSTVALLSFDWLLLWLLSIVMFAVQLNAH